MKKQLYPNCNRLFKSIFYCGPRKYNIIRAKLKPNCSALKEHLCHYLHVMDSSQCPCGSHIETIFHYFFECTLYECQRQTMINSLIPLTLDISTNTFLYGDRSNSKSLKTNFDIIDIVDNFIKDTERFN